MYVFFIQIILCLIFHDMYGFVPELSYQMQLMRDLTFSVNH